MNRTSETPPEETDIAIIGGGVAGLYAAWRLATAPRERLRLSLPNRPLRIRIFEKSDELGGRLLTEKLPGLAFNAELGAMRYINSQILISHLVDKVLGLPNRAFNVDTDFLYLRGVHCNTKVGTPDPIPYRLGRTLRGKSAGQLVQLAILGALQEIRFDSTHNRDELKAIAEKIRNFSPLAEDDTYSRRWEGPNIGLLTPREWELLKRAGRLHDRPLTDVGFWNLLHYYLRGEGFLFAHDVLGYESIVGNWNAAEAIPWYLRDFSAKYRTISTGMDNLIVKLAERLDLSCPNAIVRGREVVAIRQEEDDSLLVEYKRRGAPKNGRPRHCKASCVILALPTRALYNLSLSVRETKEERSSFTRALDAVDRHSLFKLFLGYENAWWADQRLGRAVTDLPIRQVYYFGPSIVAEERMTAKYPNGGMLMASYSDEHYVDFWRALHRRRKIEPYHFLGSRKDLTKEERQLLKLYGASPGMARKAHRQIVDLHPEFGAVKEPFVALEREWEDGWHTWRPRHKPWAERQFLKKPFKNAHILICGEAYSCEQGWIEGSLRSAELVLHELGVVAPDWIPAEGYTKHGWQSYEEYIDIWPDLDLLEEKPKRGKRAT